MSCIPFSGHVLIAMANMRGSDTKKHNTGHSSLVSRLIFAKPNMQLSCRTKEMKGYPAPNQLALRILTILSVDHSPDMPSAG